MVASNTTPGTMVGMTDSTFTKHTVATDALDTLGTVISSTESRDAIHLAVEPIEAAQTLGPGDHVMIKDGQAWRAPHGNGLGIVDPFLGDVVKKGQWFWLVVYPRTITSLKHVWEHPAFPGVGNSKSVSEAWLRGFVGTLDAQPYDGQSLFDALIESALSSEYRMAFGFDIVGEIPPEFYEHVERYTGVKIPADDRPEYFRCAC